MKPTVVTSAATGARNGSAVTSAPAPSAPAPLSSWRREIALATIICSLARGGRRPRRTAGGSATFSQAACQARNEAKREQLSRVDDQILGGHEQSLCGIFIVRVDEAERRAASQPALT